MALDLLRGFAYMQDQAEQGRQKYGERLLGEAYSAGTPEAQRGGLQKLAGAGFGRLAMDADRAFTERDNSQHDRRRQLLTDRARLIAPMPPEIRAQAWPSLRQGILAADPELAQFLPEQYDEAQFGPVINQLAGLNAADPKVLSPGAAMVDSSGRVIFQNPAVPTYSVQQGTNPDGSPAYFQIGTRGVAPGTAIPVAPGGSGSVTVGAPQMAGGQMDGMGVLSGISALSNVPGVQPTSLYRDSADNTRVGGVTNSQHMRGTAGDFVVPQSVKAAFMAQARALGFEAIDEGDHVHVELPPQGAPAGAGGGVAPQAGGGGFGQTDAQRAAAAAEAARMKVAAEETMRRQLGLEYAPAEAAAAADAARQKKEAELGAERTDSQIAAGRAFTVYQTASRELRQKMSQTTTNPVAGRIPALTAAAQIAEGSRAQMAPILKQLFRSSGEGVFTDKDQALLMDMLPDRGDHPETVTAKMDAIDALVAAKLSGVAAPAASTPAPSRGGNSTIRLKFNPETGELE